MLHLEPNPRFPGVVGHLASLTQLQLKQCKLDLANWWDRDQAGRMLVAALSQCERLVHLSISELSYSAPGGTLTRYIPVPTAVIHQMQQLTYLELARIRLRGPDQDGPASEPLQALTQLVDLRPAEVNSAADGDRAEVTANMLPSCSLAGTHHLKCLVLSHCSIEPGVLDDQTRLQHLHIANCSMPGGGAGVAKLLSHLQPLQQLQHLQLTYSNLALTTRAGNPPVAAFSALTASSMLQHLDISSCTLPTGVWQHIFPAGRQLPHLQALNISRVKGSPGTYAAAPDISLLVSCCPGLQLLDMWGLQHGVGQLAPLQGLSGLQTLSLAVDDHTAVEGVQAVCQLTGLRHLRMDLPRSADVHGLQLWQLMQLQQLTALTFHGPWPVSCSQKKVSSFMNKVGWK